MKIIKELSNNISFKELLDIYSSGGKIAIQFEEDTVLGDIGLCLDENNQGIPEEVIEDYEDIEMSEGFMLDEDGDIFACEDAYIVVEEIEGNSREQFCTVHPFAEDFDNFVLQMSLYGDSEDHSIADKVYLIEK